MRNRNLFDFETTYGGGVKFQNQLKKVKRIFHTRLETEYEFLNSLVPYSFVLGDRISKIVINNENNYQQDVNNYQQDVRKCIVEFQINFYRNQEQYHTLEWFNEIISETPLFLACQLFNHCLLNRNHNTVSLAYKLFLGERELVELTTQNIELLKMGLLIKRSILYLVMKVPKIGRSKTRLAKSIGVEKANEFARCSILDLHERLAKAFPQIQLTILFAPINERKELEEFLGDNNDSWKLQPFELEEDNRLDGLGKGLSKALTCAIGDGYTRITFIGMDSPHISNELLHHSCVASWKKSQNGLICAAEDGGYTLLSLDISHLLSFDSVEAFSNVAWSTNLAFATQLSALYRAQFNSVEVYPMVMFDVDEYPDFEKLKECIDPTLCPRVSKLMHSSHDNQLFS